MDLTDPELGRRRHTRADVDALAAKYRAWGPWGATDELGAANYVSPTTVAAAGALIRRGVVFSLALPFDRTGPQGGASARVNAQHIMLLTPDSPVLDDGGLQRFSDDAIYYAVAVSNPMGCALPRVLLRRNL